MTELPEEWVDDPPSEEIADILNTTDAMVCPHDTTHCFMQCGVALRRVPIPGGRGEIVLWEPVSNRQRRMWYAKGIEAREALEKADADWQARQTVDGTGMVITQDAVCRTVPMVRHPRTISDSYVKYVKGDDDGV